LQFVLFKFNSRNDPQQHIYTILDSGFSLGCESFKSGHWLLPQTQITSRDIPGLEYHDITANCLMPKNLIEVQQAFRVTSGHPECVQLTAMARDDGKNPSLLVLPFNW
jgi:hypothetical protein